MLMTLRNVDHTYRILYSPYDLIILFLLPQGVYQIGGPEPTLKVTIICGY